MMQPEVSSIDLSVSDFVALLNQTLDYAFTNVVIIGELANLRVSKGKWLYFDLKDAQSTVKFFGTIYHLPGPLENGMLLKVHGTPHLHDQYGFSVSVASIQPAGEGTIRRAAELLQAQLALEGLFNDQRKRRLPYPPERIGLITSTQSAAYADFIKILNARWSGLTIELIDVQVQGDIATSQIVAAIEQLNALAAPPEVIVIIRGGGSAEDLATFSTEQVTRAVAASRVPTLVAIGHEIDTSLAELAADLRASTPSNAAELLVPDRMQVNLRLTGSLRQLEDASVRIVQHARRKLIDQEIDAQRSMARVLEREQQRLVSHEKLLAAFNPYAVLRRGYAIVRKDAINITSGHQLKAGDQLKVQLIDAVIAVRTVTVKLKKG